jgi:predicted phosphoribosyltransferase/dienelactone hydrolase
MVRNAPCAPLISTSVPHPRCSSVARFIDRRDAGRQLAHRLLGYREQRPVVLGLPRGGVPVAAELARALGAPLDVLIVRKLGVPGRPEFGMGAVGEGGVRVLNAGLVQAANVTGQQLAQVEAHEQREVARRARRYRGARPMTSVRDRTTIIVDDGLATGATARAAVETVRALGAARVVLAVPVGAPDAVRGLGEVADEVVVLHTPPDLRSVGEWYADFRQTTDDEVIETLAEGRGAGHPTASGTSPTSESEVSIAVPGAVLGGTLRWPARAAGLVVFAHGSGSSRRSPRNVAVAQYLAGAGLGSLLFDLLTDEEARDRTHVFDIPLLAGRLRAATVAARSWPRTAGSPIGYFGASTGAAAALWAAADLGRDIGAVVSRGGRPDMAERKLPFVKSPTLLIVGGQDRVVLDLNRDAARRLRCEHHLEVVPGASHLFEEPGALTAVARLAGQWFLGHLGGQSRTQRPA